MQKFKIDVISKANGKLDFTKKEAQMLLDVMIEDIALWRLSRFYPESNSKLIYEVMPIMESQTTTAPPEDKDLKDIASKIYKEIIKDWKYNDTVLQICRKADFSLENIQEKVKAVNTQLKADAKNVGKSICRSASRFLRDNDISKGIDYDVIVKSGSMYPERLYVFLKGLK